MHAGSPPAGLSAARSLAPWPRQVADDTDEEMVSALAARMQEQGIRLDVVELDAPGEAPHAALPPCCLKPHRHPGQPLPRRRRVKQSENAQLDLDAPMRCPTPLANSPQPTPPQPLCLAVPQKTSGTRQTSSRI